MTNTSVEHEYRVLLPRLLGLYPQAAGGASRLALRESHTGVGHVAHGWYMRCHRGVTAVLTLEGVNLQTEAAPVRRSVLEHVVALKWLVDQGAAVADILRRGAAYDATRRKAAVQAAGWTSVDTALFDAVIQDGEGLDRTNDNLLTFKQRCDRFGTEHDWTTYLNETAQSHPSWESALPYLDITSGTPVARSHALPVIDQAGFCAIHIFEALWCMSKILDSSYLTAEVDEVGGVLENLMLRQRRELGLSVPAPSASAPSQQGQ